MLLLFALVIPQPVLADGAVTNCGNDTQLSSLLASGGMVSFNCNGTGDVATIILASTKTITTSVTIDGGGKITLSGNDVRRLFQVNSGVILTLLNITLSNGKATDGGGAVRNNGNLVIQNSTFINNSATGNYGGAIKSDGSITITNSVFSNNTAPEGYGGAIDIALTTSSVDVTSSTFDNNSAKLGGGALASNGIITITNSTFKNNITSSFQGTSGGGAIETTKLLTVSKSTFNNNTAGKGGAVYNEGGNATITNSTFSANSVNVSPYTGGAIHNQSNGTVLVIATTFSGNSATSGLGGTLYNTAGNSLTVRESILAGGSPNNCSGTIAVQGKNMETGTDCNFTASGNLQNTNPQLGVLANNGGFTQTLALLAGSPAIDAGNDATCEATDQRGVTRPQGMHCDIGAFEYVNNDVPPMVSSITRVGASPTSAASVNFTVTFSESVTGVNIAPLSDFTLTTTGVTGAAITGMSGSGTTYTVTVNTGSGNGTVRLDVVDDDSIQDGSNNPLGGVNVGNGNFTTGQTYLIVKQPSFGDVPASNPYWQYIEVLYANGLTNGCSTSPLLYCPSMIMNRAQVAKFFMTVQFGGSYLPPANTPLVFQDNWSNNPWAQIWANDMKAKGLTNGCSLTPVLYCPDTQVPREQVAKFGLAIKHGNTYTPPPANGTVFADLQDVSYWATAWAEQAYLEGLVPACGTDAGTGKPKFCPQDKVDRGFAAFVIVTATGLLGP